MVLIYCRTILSLILVLKYLLYIFVISDSRKYGESSLSNMIFYFYSYRDIISAYRRIESYFLPLVIFHCDKKSRSFARVTRRQFHKIYKNISRIFFNAIKCGWTLKTFAITKETGNRLIMLITREGLKMRFRLIKL